MERRNKRDAKFLIFQSLYIIAISILFYKGTDLSLKKVAEINPDMKQVPITSVIINPELEEALPKPEEGKEYTKINLKDQEIVNREELEKLKKEKTELELENTRLRNQKTPVRQPVTTRSEVKGKQTVTIPGERNK
ncbi:MAG: hypothetical protein IPM96_08850 [Ignavibacteria bacterium]|nr:hypothetical protein [Ignavibacteria bacterium]